ncbi:MAG: hypothetical protein ACRD2G_12160 [Terriglobia bacterium]
MSKGRFLNQKLGKNTSRKTKLLKTHLEYQKVQKTPSRKQRPAARRPS